MEDTEYGLDLKPGTGYGQSTCIESQRMVHIFGNDSGYCVEPKNGDSIAENALGVFGMIGALPDACELVKSIMRPRAV